MKLDKRLGYKFLPATVALTMHKARPQQILSCVVLHIAQSKVSSRDSLHRSYN